MLYKPSNISPDNQVFSSSEAIAISWTNNGDLMTKFKIFVYNNDSGLSEFESGEVNSAVPYYSIPPLSLTSGTVYKYQIQVFNSNGDSVYSDFKIFSCSSVPVVTIDTDGYVRNQKATFMANYSQAESIGLKCYKFILFDSFDRVLEESDYIYNTDLIYPFDYILIDNVSYKVECIAIAQNGLSGTSGKISFVADYVPPNVYFQLSTENDISKPYMRLHWTTVRIIGKTDGTTAFIDDEKLDVRNGKVYYDKGLSLEGNFTFHAWILNPINESDLFGITGNNFSMTIKYYGNRIHVFTNICGYTSHIASDVINIIDENSNVHICLTGNNGLMNIRSEVL